MIKALVRGGGDLASGTILRLARVGVSVLVTELPRPLAVRRRVSFAQAVYDGEITIEGVTGRLITNQIDVEPYFTNSGVGVVVDPGCTWNDWFHPDVIVDGRMLKRDIQLDRDFQVPVLGLGPGFECGINCTAVVETQRGPYLGRVIWSGSAAPDTGEPDRVQGFQNERVLRAPSDGVVFSHCEIGERIRKGQIVAKVESIAIEAPFDGVLRGLLQSGLFVTTGTKVGDLDPRDLPELSFLVSDKALAVGGGVLEAMLSFPELRRKMNS